MAQVGGTLAPNLAQGGARAAGDGEGGMIGPSMRPGSPSAPPHHLAALEELDERLVDRVGLFDRGEMTRPGDDGGAGSGDRPRQFPLLIGGDERGLFAPAPHRW